MLNPQPKRFTWLFLGTPKGDVWTGKPVTLRIRADTEAEARDALSSWNLTFAAKIRSDCPLTCNWMEGDFIWTLIGTDARKAWEVQYD